MDFEKIREIVNKSGVKGLAYGFVGENELHVRLGPLSIPRGGWHYSLARKIAEKHEINFEEYNFNVGTDDPPRYRPVFSAICYSEEELEEKIRRLMQAEEELNKRCEWLADFVMKS